MAITHNPESAIAAIDKTEIAQVPTCKFWLPCDESDDSITTLTDAVSGETVTIAAATASAGGIAIPNDTSAEFSGVLPALAGDFALLCMINTSEIAATISYGTGAQKIQFGASSVINGASTTAALDAVAAATLTKVLIYSDITGDAYLYQAAPGAALANTLNPLGNHGAVTPTNDILDFSAFTTNTVYGLAVLDLATGGIPDDLVVWADWTLEQWYANNKVLPPRFTEYT